MQSYVENLEFFSVIRNFKHILMEKRHIVYLYSDYLANVT
jgi:hypothetical protein